MGTRIRDKASNTDTSIILDSGTSYVKRDDQTVPVYRGITSTNLIGDLGGAPLYAPTFQVTSTGSQTFNITGWQSDYKCVLTGMECGYENRRVVSLAGARVLSDGACTVNYFEGSSNTNKTGTISLNTSTGVITTNNLNQFNLFVSVWDGLNAGVSATQTNLDAALARITQLENNAGGGGLIDVTTYIISSSPQNLGTFPNFDPSQRVYWVLQWYNVPTNGTRVYYNNANQTGHSVSVSSTGQITGWKSGTAGDYSVTLARFTAA